MCCGLESHLGQLLFPLKKAVVLGAVLLLPLLCLNLIDLYTYNFPDIGASRVGADSNPHVLHGLA